MRCRKVRSFLSAYCRGETTPDATTAIDSHLEDCTICRREAEVYRSLNAARQELPTAKVTEDFNTRLFQRIAREGTKPVRTRPMLPSRIPRFGTSRLTAYAVTAVVILAMGIGVQLSDQIFAPGAAPLVLTTPTADDGGDLYLTVQPTDNPLLNEHKSVSKMIQQYNRFREYSRSLRSMSSVDQFLGNAGGAIMTSAGSSNGSPMVHFRPVVKSYLIVPGNNASNAGAVY